MKVIKRPLPRRKSGGREGGKGRSPQFEKNIKVL
jgi:hypothetical protein